MLDLAIVAYAYGWHGTGTNSPDVNDDHCVDLFDLVFVARYLSAPPAMAAAEVPVLPAPSARSRTEGDLQSWEETGTTAAVDYAGAAGIEAAASRLDD